MMHLLWLKEFPKIIHGNAFETFIFLELMKANKKVNFWRTKNKQEVDFILDSKRLAIEIKSSNKVHSVDLKNLTLLAEDGPIRQRLLVSQVKEARAISDRFGKIDILPWPDFLQKLWAGEYK